MSVVSKVIKLLEQTIHLLLIVQIITSILNNNNPCHHARTMITMMLALKANF